jgi:glycosyltransferase involved in cell wall biosynthesis
MTWNSRSRKDTPPPLSQKKIIVAFYASTRYGSEYRAGAEFIQFASSIGFDLAVVADLQQNNTPDELAEIAPGISVVTVPSPVTQQKLLYRFTDFVPQSIWHHRVARWLRGRYPSVEVVWIQNGALPWLPISPYFGLTRTLVWGPIGGGGSPPEGSLRHLRFSSRLREQLRSTAEQLAIDHKVRAIRGRDAPRVVALARTVEIQQRFQSLLSQRAVPVIPEFLDPVQPAVLARSPRNTPRFVWVGQDIPRKNLPLALSIFETLRKEAFPEATLDVFGVRGNSQWTKTGVHFHGWVSRLDWENYRNDGILLLTSFREGLPSVVLDAVSNGLLCITSDVGSLSSLRLETIQTLPRAEYPRYSSDTFNLMINRIKRHLSEVRVCLARISHRDQLLAHLHECGVIE